MQNYSDSVLNTGGKPVAGALVKVTNYPSGTAALIYATFGGGSVGSVVTDENGRFSFYAADGHYNITVSGRGIVPYTLTDVALNDPDNDSGGVRVDKFFNAAESTATGMFQRAIDAVFAAGGGSVEVRDGLYSVGPSTSNEVFDNYGAAWPANYSALILRKGVSLRGTGSSRCKIVSTTPTITVLTPVSIENATIEGIEIDGGWNVGASGAGHGIFTLAGPGGADAVCKNLKIIDVVVRNVASYGIGLQCGVPQGTTFDRIRIENTGADAFDLKSRLFSEQVSDGLGNTASNISIKNHGRRVIGSAGMDVRGVWGINNVQVTDFGVEPGLQHVGVRFRTKPPPGDGNRVGSKSSLSNFYIRPRPGVDITNIYGVVSGSDDVHIANGTVESCWDGVLMVGNANGGTLRNTVVNVTALNSGEFGFMTSTSTTEATFIGCNSVGAAVAGFRDTGVNTRLIGCRSLTDAAALSTSAGAEPTQTILSCDFGIERGLSIGSSAAGRVEVNPKGATTDIELRLYGKGGSGVAMYVNAARALDASNPTSAVNFVRAKGSATGSAVELSAQGADVNTELRLTSKGSGLVAAYVNAARGFDVTNPVGAVNWISARGATAGSPVQFSAQGSDANIDLRLAPKGTGLTRFGIGTAAADTASTIRIPHRLVDGTLVYLMATTVAP